MSKLKNKITTVGNHVRLIIDEVLEDDWLGIVPLELISGQRRELPDGMVQYDFEMDDDKILMLRSAIIDTFGLHPGQKES